MVNLTIFNNFYYPLVKTKCTKVWGKDLEICGNFKVKLSLCILVSRVCNFFLCVFLCMHGDFVTLHGQKGITQPEMSQISNEFGGAFTILRRYILVFL